MNQPCKIAVVLFAALALSLPVEAQIDLGVPAEVAGSDGAFEPGADIVIDLSLAATGSWDEPGTGLGVYDCEKWAVVFKYSSVTIPAGVTVTFRNHPSRAPVVWLVAGDVLIDEGATVDLSGDDGPGEEAGPGGFPAGALDGFGPGGGLRRRRGDSQQSGGGGFGQAGPNFPEVAGQPYGNPQLVPLIGGSAGAAGAQNTGGAGGGAMLIAGRGGILLDGVLRSDGGDSVGGAPGSGGGLRLVAFRIEGGGLVSVDGGGVGGDGRIRLEAADGISPDIERVGVWTQGAPGARAVIWPEDLGFPVPSVRILQVHESAPFPAACQGPGGFDPRASRIQDETDRVISAAEATLVLLETENVPLDWIVTVRWAASNQLAAGFAIAEPGPGENLWSALLQIPDDTVAVLQARARAP